MIINGVEIGPVSSYTFRDIRENYTVNVMYEVDNTSTTVPITPENLKYLINCLAEGTVPEEGDFDFNGDGVINGKDVILAEMQMMCNE